MATWADIKGDRISFLRIIAGFLPLAFGCFLSVLFQRIDSVVADDLMTDLVIGEVALGVSTVAFLLAFAACLLPAGIAIDRFGPRLVQTVMMAVTALGALIISLSTGFFSFTIGRVLLGIGIASALLAGLKAVAAWCPRERLGLVTGGLIAVGGLGALAAADPAARFVQTHGWGTLFILLAALAAICALLSALLIPTPPPETDDEPDQDDGLPFVLRDPIFPRLAPLAVVVIGTVWAMKGHWVAGWLAAASGVEFNEITGKVSLIAFGQTAASLALGALADWAVRKGLSTASVLVGAVALCICIQVVAVGAIASPSFIVLASWLGGAAVVMPYVVLLTYFPQSYAARASAIVGVLQVFATLFIQAVMGLLVAAWPHTASAQTSATAYAMAFMVPIASQFAALAWFLLARSETGGGAQYVGELAVAFASLRSAAHSLAGNLQPLLDNLTQRRGGARAGRQAHGATERPSPDGLSADIAAGPTGIAPAPTGTTGETTEAAPASAETADVLTDIPAVSARLAAEPAHVEPADLEPADLVSADLEPSDAAARPIDTALETAGETVVPASASAETVEASTDTPAASASPAAGPAETVAAAPADPVVEPTGGRVARGETSALTDAALRSILGAPVSVGLRGASDTALRGSAEPPKVAAPADEIAQPAEGELSFPLVAPSHVQALNAVYRRRPALAAMIGGRQLSIVAAWAPDRRRDASHRLTLRLDGEPGELWLPQSLLDVLVGSVDPALSLERLGSDRAAIILEYALDSVLTAVETNLGCKLAVDSFAGRAERVENDGQLPLFFNVVIEGLVTTGCELRLPPEYAVRLAEGLDRHAGISRSAVDLSLPVCLRVGATNLAVAEIERLSPDDVVLVEGSSQPGQAVIAVIGERFVAPVALSAEGLRLAAHPIPGATSPWAWSLPTDASWEADAADNRSLHVLFEIGRFELPVSKVKQLAPNAPLPLGPPRDQSVDIMVGGQRFGRGTLMRIGNRTGIRIDSLRERQRAGSKRASAGERTSSE